MPTFSEAPRPVCRLRVGRSPGSRVIAFSGLPGLTQWLCSEKGSPPTVAGAASVGSHTFRVTTSNSLYPNLDTDTDKDVTQPSIPVK